VLAASARRALEKPMQSGKYEYQTELARRYVAEGDARGRSHALLGFLAAQGFSISDTQRAHVLACEDTALLDRWIARIATATSTTDVIEYSEAGSSEPG
jgi:hypothetical protein